MQSTSAWQPRSIHCAANFSSYFVSNAVAPSQATDGAWRSIEVELRNEPLDRIFVPRNAAQLVEAKADQNVGSA